MNLNLKAVYVCVNNAGRWGKGLTIAEAKKNAGMRPHSPQKSKIEYYVQAALFNSEGMTNEEFENLKDCITVNNISGSPEYYKDNRTTEDTDMITKYHVGWLTVESNIKS